MKVNCSFAIFVLSRSSLTRIIWSKFLPKCHINFTGIQPFTVLCSFRMMIFPDAVAWWRCAINRPVLVLVGPSYCCWQKAASCLVTTNYPPLLISCVFKISSLTLGWCEVFRKISCVVVSSGVDPWDQKNLYSS